MDAEASPPHSKATSLLLPGSWSEISTELPEEGKCQHRASLALHSMSTPKPPGPGPLSELPYHRSTPVPATKTLSHPASATRSGTGAQWKQMRPHSNLRPSHCRGHGGSAYIWLQLSCALVPTSSGPACPTKAASLLPWSFYSHGGVPHTELGLRCRDHSCMPHLCPGSSPASLCTLGLQE